MINRLLNSTLPNAERQDWLSLLSEIAADPRCEETARDEARHFIEYQAACSPLAAVKAAGRGRNGKNEENK